MLTLLAVFIGSTVGTAFARLAGDLLFRRRESKELPFKWTCVEEYCTTRFAASHSVVLERLRTDHMNSRHGKTPTSDNN